MTINSRWLNWRQIILDDAELSFGAKSMALFLNTYMNDSHDMAYPSIATICGRLNISNKTAIKYTSELSDFKYLVKQKRFGTSTVYISNIPKRVTSCVDSPLVEEVHHSCVKFTPTVVEDLHTNKQVNKQVNKQGGRKVFKKPTLKEIKECIKSHNYNVDPDSFFHFYESKDWMIGKNKMKKWESALAQWNARNKKESSKEDESWGI